MDNKNLINRSIYRELFNDLCADYSIYRLKHKIDDEFLEMESKLWEYREKSLYMENEDVQEFDNFLNKGESYLIERLKNEIRRQESK